MKKRKHILPLAAAMGSLALIAGSAHAAVITPIGVTASAEWSTTTGAANNLLGPGITEVNPSDVTTWTHGNIEWNVAPREGWFQWNADSIGATLDFDLGGTFTVSDAHVWNWNGVGSFDDWGVKDITLTFSDNATFGDLGDTTQSIVLSQATGLPTYTGDHFALTPVAGVTHIRLTVDSSLPGNNGITALSEVRFSGGPAGPDNDPPVISTLSPADDATGVAPAVNLVATFDEDIALKTGGTVTIRNLGPSLDPDEVITIPNAARLSVLDNVLTINPATDLDTGNNYAVRISNDVIEDLAASPNGFAGISDDTTWNFTTSAPDTTAPIINTLSPADDASGVGPTTNLLATFDEDIALTGVGTITVTDTTDASSSFTIDLSSLPDPGAAVSVSGAELTIDPATDLEANTAYAVQISADAIEDLSGNDFAGILNNDDWTFTTGGTSVVITPVSVTPSTEWSATPGTGAASNLLGPGFTQNDPIETSMHGNSEWNVAPHEGWFQWNADAIGATLDFDLGDTFTIEKAHIWNWNGNGGGNPSYNTWAAENITLTFSDNATFGDAGDTTQTVTLNRATGQPTYTGDHFALTPVAGVTHIRLEVVSSLPGNNGITALAEVRFSGSAPLATITSFEGAGTTGVIDQTATTIALDVPFGTDLAILAPTFTLSSGTCDQASGALPSPTNFADAPGNTVDYVVTDTSTDPDTVNTYSVTVTVAPEPPVLATLVIDLGTSPAGTTIEGGAFIGSGPTNLPLPSLPAGSILQSIAVAIDLESKDNENFTNDLAVLVDPTPGTPGGDFSLGIISPDADVDFSLGETLQWVDGGHVNAMTETKTDADWSGDIDLASNGLFLGNAFGGPTTGGTWSGTITLTYVVGSGGGNSFGTWIAGYDVGGQTGIGDDPDLDGVDSGVENFFGTAPDTFTQGLVSGMVDTDADTFTFTHPLNATPADDLTATYRWSTDLQDFYDDGDPNGAGTTRVDFVQGTPLGGMVTVTATITGTVIPDKLLVDVEVTQN